MHAAVRPVRAGLILGVIGLLFGIAWAIYIAAFHEQIHRDLSSRAGVTLASGPGIFGVGLAEAHTDARDGVRAEAAREPAHQDAAEEPHGHGDDAAEEPHGHGDDAAEEPHGHMDDAAEEPHGHGDDAAEEAHERLARGHLHAMGLGLVTLVVSLVLAFISAPLMAKTIASACLGVGGLFYPLSWIIMGYRTVAIGAEAAEKSVLPIVGPSVLLVGIGLLMCIYYLMKGVLSGE
jgi:hypothetical protein